MDPKPHVIDVTDASFESAVLEASHEVPVLVDFWAPWCGPCQTLGPLLESLAQESAGDFLLAKVDIDQNPAIAGSLGVQSIPFVMAFRDGAIVNQFVGAQSEAVVRQFLERLLPDQADRLVGEAESLADQGEAAPAEARFRQALEQRPQHARATLGLARLLADDAREEEAELLVGTVAASGDTGAALEHLAAELRTRRGGEQDESTLRERIARDPGDLAARVALGHTLAAAKRSRDALAEFLEVVRLDRDYEDAAARKAMLDIFTLLGNDDPLVDEYRRQLAQILYS